jgi:hypothetical protein
VLKRREESDRIPSESLKSPIIKELGGKCQLVPAWLPTVLNELALNAGEEWCAQRNAIALKEKQRQ